MREKNNERSLGVLYSPFQSSVTDGTTNGHDFLDDHRKLQNSLNFVTVKLN